MDKKKRDELRAKLRSKIGEKKISRSGKVVKEKVMGTALNSIGLDLDKLKADIEAVRKQGGLTVNIKKN